MRAAERQGARIFERSFVRRVDATSTGVRVRTRRGTIAATQAIVATGYATATFKPLAGRFRLTHTYVLATQPIAARARREAGPGDVMLWDTRRPYHYGRWTADRRLLLGGGDRPLVPARLRASAARILLEHFNGQRSPDHRLFAFDRFRRAAAAHTRD